MNIFLGILVFEMLNGYCPFIEEDIEDLFEAIQYGEFKMDTGRMSESSMSFVQMLLEKEPFKRLGGADSPHGDIRKHRFFAQIDWAKLEKKQLKPLFAPSCVRSC